MNGCSVCKWAGGAVHAACRPAVGSVQHPQPVPGVGATLTPAFERWQLQHMSQQLKDVLIGAALLLGSLPRLFFFFRLSSGPTLCGLGRLAHLLHRLGLNGGLSGLAARRSSAAGRDGGGAV